MLILDVVSYAVLIYVLLFISFILMNEILIFGYLFVDYNLKALYKPQEYAHASAATYLRNYWLEVIYILSKFLLYPLQWVNLSLNTRSENDTAILLVHGYCRNQTDWLWMRKQLQSTGCPIFCVNLKPMLGPIQEIAATSLAPKIAKIKEQTKCKHIVLIAHSMGGLVCGYYSEFMDDQNLIKAVIGIGTPFYGTKIAIAGPGQNARQMCPGSKFLEELHVPMHHSSKKYYQVASKFDNKLFPWQSALVETSPTTQQYVMPLIGHLCMLASKDVANQLKVWLNDLNSQ